MVLAVEEQFYLAGPLMLLVGLRFLKRRRALLLGILALAVLSAAAMAWLYQPTGSEPCLLWNRYAHVRPAHRGSACSYMAVFHKLKPRVSNEAKLTLDIIGGMALLMSLLAFWYTNEYQPFLYLGGMLLLSFVSMLLIMTAAHPASRIGRLLSISAASFYRRSFLWNVFVALSGHYFDESGCGYG